VFDYAADTPLNVATHTAVRGLTVREISYDNGDGGRCLATLVTPRRPTGTGVVIAHGGTGDGRRFFLTEALALAGLGMTVLLPVTELPRHGDIEATGRAIRRHVRAHRRSVDVLETVTEGRGLLHFYGHSGGGSQGALLSAVEPRIAAFAITSIGSGTIVRLAAAELPPGTEATDRYLRFLEQFDPAISVAVPRSAPPAVPTRPPRPGGAPGRVAEAVRGGGRSQGPARVRLRPRPRRRRAGRHRPGRPLLRRSVSAGPSGPLRQDSAAACRRSASTAMSTRARSVRWLSTQIRPV
jgi:hypothetical protein